MKQYSITTNNGLPNAKIHNFVDRVDMSTLGYIRLITQTF